MNKTPSIFRTWLPLALMWLIMGIEQPLVTAMIARMEQSMVQLAAFGVAFSLALFMESTVIQMLAAGTAIADSRENYRRLLQMMHVIGGFATIVHGILCIPTVFYAFASVVLGVPEVVIQPAYLAFLSLLPWTLSVGYRRLWQGVLIRNHRTKFIPVAMSTRIAVIIVILVWAYSSGKISGALAGGISFSAGVILSVIITRYTVNPLLKKLPAGDGASRLMTWKKLIRFYIPLALTNFIKFGIRPIVQIGLARGLLPLESLAIWPVFVAYIFLYNSLSLASQEVVIARLNHPEDKRRILHFYITLASILTAVYVQIVLTPLWPVWSRLVFNFGDSLAEISRIPIILALPIIPIMTFTSLFRGTLIYLKRTSEVSYGVLIYAIVLIVLHFIGVALLSYPGIIIAAGSFTLAFLAEMCYLASRRPLKEITIPADISVEGKT